MVLMVLTKCTIFPKMILYHTKCLASEGRTRFQFRLYLGFVLLSGMSRVIYGVNLCMLARWAMQLLPL